ncbi:hypothetical protein MYBA111488_24515 [Mycobacterium basiliense]
MNPEPVHGDAGVVGDGDFGEYFLVAPPQRGQSSKRWPVVITALGQPRVGITDIDRQCACGGPHR